ncbi:hydroxyacid dehydrogenase [Jannaschia seohaensis]|uniref:(S)-sulfolactate dehydrogenase n=1 Tax=Jannaschia seohaensis TaxID=475081 RepID=A0A2Y9B087_9RHOB|nr:hydroxyacid dehydrogenase [Jannaschia seohaensis]PWJ15071.1 (S)-sulfolactate dehydrogenase [Jannaschia seohaensis]SSA49920.1 (S)-sulfolactate dehydrogenase [Jannaschia seohaensis]
MILITEFMDETWVDWLRERSPVTYEPDLPDRPDDLARLAREARALIVRNRTQVRGDLLDAGFACVGRLGVGLDNIDLDGCHARGIEVFPATGANTLSVAEYVVTTAAMLLRGAYGLRAQMEAGAWPRAQAGQGREIAGKILGLVGYGEIARVTGRLGRALGMEVIASDPFAPDFDGAREATLEEVLEQADIVSLHVPLTEATKNLIDAGALAAMRPGAVLVNAARGGVVDEAALCEALRAGRLGGAALDTFADEPLGADHPFTDVPNLILTPHIGGVTREANTRVSEMTARKVASHLGLV